MKKLILRTNNIKYPIIINQGLLDSPKSFFPLKSGDEIIIITNKKLYLLYFKKIRNILRSIGIKIDKIIIKDEEKNKSLFTINQIFTKLLKKSYVKNNITLVALGGGVIGDLTGFVASCYQRGTKFIQIPTTLLSQVDSSIGGKNGINHILGKNMIGTFHHPILVIIDLNTLKTLPKKEISSGLAEIIKYGIMADYQFFCWLEKNIKNILKLQKNEINYCVYKSCKIKAKIVHEDEKELNGKRFLLNLGHTFAHAIETETKYKFYTHGEAVSIGMIIAAKISEIIGKIDKKNINRIINLIKRANLPTKSPLEITPETYLFHIKKDKKQSNNQINLILPETPIGKSKFYKNIEKKIIIEAIQQCY